MILTKYIHLCLFANFLNIATSETFLIKSNINHTRKGKFFPFFSIIRFPNTECPASGNFNGTCFTRRECHDLKGLSSGTCASKKGVCCVVQRTCGGFSNVNSTYFTNIGYPGSFGGGPTCTIRIQRCNPDICQVRLDFLDLTLAQPDGDGNCVNDYLTITGGSSIVPRICGENTGQHVYVNFDGDNDIILSIISNSAFAFNRRWNIKITQISCNCPWLAPNGCLMYYTGVSGTVKSFNYGSTPNIATAMSGLTGTRQIANHNYGICIRMEAGYCSIRWSQTTDPYSFTVSDNTESTDLPLLGTPEVGLMGNQCTTDFVVIPNPSSFASDRFCGLGFPPVTTFSKPFVLTVVTDQNEGLGLNGANPDAANRGFVLNYMQQQCAFN